MITLENVTLKVFNCAGCDISLELKDIKDIYQVSSYSLILDVLVTNVPSNFSCV